jgi:hypothetical protein
MNVNDVEKVPEVEGCRLQAIFDRQKELHETYKVIEAKKGIGYGILVSFGLFNLDHAESQYYIKDMCWRVTEEMMESLEAMLLFIMQSRPEDEIHGIEELSDALHFMVELLIICGCTPENVCAPPDKRLPNFDRLDILWKNSKKGWPRGACVNVKSLNQFYMEPIYFLGLACNCLKNKPWKQTQIVTDRKRFYKYLSEALQGLIAAFRYVGVDSQGIYDIYFRKSEVNKFRQRSQY